MRLKCLLSVYAFALFWGTIALFVFPSLLIYALVYPFRRYPQDTFQYLSSIIYKIFFKLLPRVELKFELADELPRSAIYIATHQSSLDYPIMGSFVQKYLTVTNLHFTKIPFASFVGKLIGARSLNKNSLSEIALMYREFEETLNDNRNIIIFPEGTRSDGKKLHKFKKGAFRLAINTNKPIVPIVIDGSAKLLAKGDPCFKTTAKVTIRVTMKSIIYPQEFDSEVQMMEFARSEMSYTQ